MGVRKAPIRPSKLISCPHLHMLALHAMPSWCYAVTLACVYLRWQASPVKISSKCRTLGIIIDSCFHFPKRQLKMAWVSLNVPTSTSIQSSLYFKRKKNTLNVMKQHLSHFAGMLPRNLIPALNWCPYLHIYKWRQAYKNMTMLIKTLTTHRIQKKKPLPGMYYGKRSNMRR